MRRRLIGKSLEADVELRASEPTLGVPHIEETRDMFEGDDFEDLRRQVRQFPLTEPSAATPLHARLNNPMPMASLVPKV